MQRALMLAILQAYADFRKENEETNKNFLFFIDEGELHLHPTAQRSLKTALMELSDKGDQVFINTHSSVLVTDEHDSQTIYKVEKLGGMTEVQAVSEDKKPAIIYDLLSGSPADLLLPRNFLLVEGRTDADFINGVVERFYGDKPAVQVVFAEGDHERQAHSMEGINKIFGSCLLQEFPFSCYKFSSIFFWGQTKNTQSYA
jgi:putative ATP-dependent endonuclease of the OLD family